MIRHFTILFGILSLCFFTACGGGGDDQKPPPMPPQASVTKTGQPPNGMNCVPAGQSNLSAVGPYGGTLNVNVQASPAPGMHCMPVTMGVDPQALSDLQTAFNNAKQVCCSTYAPVVAAATAQYPNPNPQIPAVSGSACDQAVIQATLLGKTIYAPWGGDAYPPYNQWMMAQGKAVVNCIGSASGITNPNDPRIAYVLNATAPVIQPALNGPAGAYWGLGMPYMYQVSATAIKY